MPAVVFSVLVVVFFSPAPVLAETAPPAAVSPADMRLHVDILGVEGAVQENVKLHVSAYAAEKSGALLNERKVKRLVRTTKEEVRTALQAFGYYQSAIVSRLDRKEAWRLTLNVDPGPVTRYRDVQLQLVGEGSEAAALQKIVERSAPRPGEPVLHGPYQSMKSALQKRAYDLGYLDVKFTEQVLRVYPQESVADVVLTLDTGKRYYFGEITVEQDILDADYIAKFVRPESGDPFESEQLLALQQALTESNYFSHVSLELERDAARGQRIPVVVKTAARKRARYGASLGYGTDTGARAGLSTELRRLNRRGHRFSGEVEVSEVSASLASRYSIPVGDVRSESLDFTARAEREDINDVDAREYRLGATLNQNRWGGQRRISLALLHDNWSFGDGPTSEATLLIPGLDLTVKNADDPFFAQRGYSYTLQLRGAAEGVASDVDFVQAVLFGRAVHALTERSRLLFRAEYGATVTDAFDNLPPSLRFFAGGSQSVRGYGYKDLSPFDDDGNRIGGKYFAALGVELDYLIKGNMGIAAFVDAGDATRDPIDTLKMGAGLGFRYRSPVGMFRVDLAHPLDDPDTNVRLHLSFGADL